VTIHIPSPPRYTNGTLNKHFPFIIQMVALGLAIALVAVFVFPQWFGPDQRVVAVHEEPPPSPLRHQPPSLRASYAQAVAAAAPAVVNVFTSKVIVKESHPLVNDPLFNPLFRDPVFAPRLEHQTSLGSGVIISPKGYILTNNHVIAGADQIKVVLPNGRRLAVKAIGADPETDIAVLKADAEDLPSITVRSSKLKVGDIVLAIGDPFGIGQTVTQGIISATGRNQLGLNTIEDFIQTDAAINPGSSGGALVDVYGRLVGINTAIHNQSGSTGIGFAIPVNLARDVMTQIIEHGQVIRGWLGVEGTDVPETLIEKLNLPEHDGVMITAVIKDGPAEKAGLQPKDILLEVNDQPIKGVRQALSLIARSKPGTELSFKGIRDGKPFTTKAAVSIRPIIKPAAKPAQSK